MSERKFKKAKAWMGKDLSLHVGGGDKKIFDNVVLVGAEYAKFVGLGFLVEIKDEAKNTASAPVAAPVAQTEQLPVEKSQSSGTKSPASKVADGVKKGWGGGKKEPKEPKKEKDSKEAEEVKAETPAEPPATEPAAPAETPVETPSDEKKDEAPPSE